MQRQESRSDPCFLTPASLTPASYWIKELDQSRVKSISAHPELVDKEWVPFSLLPFPSFSLLFPLLTKKNWEGVFKNQDLTPSS